LFERHDRTRFGIYAYSYGIDTNDAAQTRIAGAVDVFRRISTLDDAAICQMIHQDGIDILVDLKGYTTGSRLGMLSARSAPVQMHYLGFPGTLCAEFIDYFITDSIASPLHSSSEFSEKLIRLPHSYQMNDRSRPLPKPATTRASYGLPEKGFVFCGFNRPYKITHDIFSAWMRLLKATPESVLWLYETNPEVSVNLRSEAQKQGIDPSRIIMAGRAPLAEHLARYAHVDLFLDTAPVCGHTTASDALWCGVPVITLSGDTFISRVAASLLHAVGLPELIMPNIEAYEAEALALARDPARLAKLHQHLADTRLACPLFDSLATTRALEAAYEQAATRHAAAQAPASFNVTPDFLT
jgi:predicted O-linked N-acetylglucosamine transferase (SPINDLY family)